MGGRRGSRTQRKHFKQSRENVWKRPKTESSSDPNNPNSNNHAWQPFATQNPSFDEYYKVIFILFFYLFHLYVKDGSVLCNSFFWQEQGIVSPEEWDAFMEMLRKPLPAAFRINATYVFLFFLFFLLKIWGLRIDRETIISLLSNIFTYLLQ